METNFFQQVSDLQLIGDLHLSIAKGADNNLVVSVLLKNEQCGDRAKNLIVPCVLRETAQELDRLFFDYITKPMQGSSQLMVNMEHYLKQQELAKQQSAMEKEKADNEKKAKEEREKKYRDAMQKVDELEKEGKYRDAWTKVPEPMDYPEHRETIQQRRSMLATKFAPDLFAEQPPVVEERPMVEEPEAYNEPDTALQYDDYQADPEPDLDEDNEDDF